LTGSYVTWGTWFGAFVVLELLGLFRRYTHVPWESLSRTIWALETWSAVQIIVLAGLTILTAHLVFQFPRGR
jgi:hypothetical protein